MFTHEPDKSSIASELSSQLRISSVIDAAKTSKIKGIPNKPCFVAGSDHFWDVDRVMKNVKSQKNAVPGKQGGLNAEVQARIGHQLRAMYDDVVKQGVPDRFADLIRQLDAAEASVADAPKSDGRE